MASHSVVPLVQHGMESDGVRINACRKPNTSVTYRVRIERDDDGKEEKMRYQISSSISIHGDTLIDLGRFNLNYAFEPEDHRDKKFQSLLAAPIDPKTLPKTVDHRAAFGSVIDQGDLGSCVSNSVGYTLRFELIKKKLPLFLPARLFIYWFGRLIEGSDAKEDTGLYVRTGYDAVKKYAICGENNWPYKVKKFSVEPNKVAIKAATNHALGMYVSLNSDLNELKQCLKEGYIISFGFTVFASFMTLKVAQTGHVPMPTVQTEEQMGGHCMTIVGYDDDRRVFIVANSWGEDWGDKGFCYFPYDFMMNEYYCSDFWSPRAFK